MDQVAAIRHAVLTLKHSRRWAARNFKVARRTVDRYLDDDVTPRKRNSPPRPAPKKEAAAVALTDVIADTPVTKKQQLTAKRAWELLTERGVDVSYTLVKELMAERRRATREVFVPLIYKPGDLAEVDFFEVEVDVDAERVTAFLFVMRLMSSSRDFCWVYPRQDQTCFLDGHVRAFAHFEGAPQRVAYDNLRAAVRKFLVGGGRELSPRFLAATSHYAFEACFCRPYEGHDKGGVEARGKNVRLQSLVPVPSGLSLDEVSRKVLVDVEKRFWNRTDAKARWSSESSALTTPPRLPLDPRKTNPAASVSPSSTVNIEGSTYSVPSSWVRLNITTHAGVDEVEMVGPRGESVRRRRVPKGKSDIDYAAHYIAALATKPQAVRQVADVLMTQLGAPFPDWWQRLVDDDGPRDAARKMARILRGIIELGREECERRVAETFVTGEAITTALLVPASSKAAPLSLVPKSLDVEVESSSVRGFDDLMGAGAMGGAA